ncbi:hypothetical protein APUTEX25_002010, partial [Auxenochlorella protothecoides]
MKGGSRPVRPKTSIGFRAGRIAADGWSKLRPLRPTGKPASAASTQPQDPGPLSGPSVVPRDPRLVDGPWTDLDGEAVLRAQRDAARLARESSRHSPGQVRRTATLDIAAVAALNQQAAAERERKAQAEREAKEALARRRAEERAAERAAAKAEKDAARLAARRGKEPDDPGKGPSLGDDASGAAKRKRSPGKGPDVLVAEAYEDGACRLHAIQSGMHRLRADAGTAVQDEEDLKSLLQRIQHRVKDAVVGGDPRHHQRGHPPRPQQLHQARRDDVVAAAGTGLATCRTLVDLVPQLNAFVAAHERNVVLPRELARTSLAHSAQSYFVKPLGALTVPAAYWWFQEGHLHTTLPEALDALATGFVGESLAHIVQCELDGLRETGGIREYIPSFKELLCVLREHGTENEWCHRFQAGLKCSSLQQCWRGHEPRAHEQLQRGVLAGDADPAVARRDQHQRMRPAERHNARQPGGVGARGAGLHPDQSAVDLGAQEPVAISLEGDAGVARSQPLRIRPPQRVHGEEAQVPAAQGPKTLCNACGVLAVGEHFGRRPSNVVFMGMGEPMLNLPSVLAALRALREDLGMGARHLTLSTVGVPGTLRQLAARRLQVTLAVSLHAPTQELRERIVPSARVYPLQALMADCTKYFEVSGRRVSFEYTLMAGVNDQPQHAIELTRLLRQHRSMRCHVNLIPWNAVDDAGAWMMGDLGEFKSPSREAVEIFKSILEERRVPVSVRITRGLEAAAACGQLRNMYQKTPLQEFERRGCHCRKIPASRASLAMAARDLTLHISSKLAGEWSAPNVAGMLTAPVLEYLVSKWSDLDTMVKTRLLLAPLAMKGASLEELRPQLQAMVEAGVADKDEWVRVMALAVGPYDGRIHLGAVAADFKLVGKTLDELVSGLREADPLLYRPQ